MRRSETGTRRLKPPTRNLSLNDWEKLINKKQSRKMRMMIMTEESLRRDCVFQAVLEHHLWAHLASCSRSFRPMIYTNTPHLEFKENIAIRPCRSCMIGTIEVNDNSSRWNKMCYPHSWTWTGPRPMTDSLFSHHCLVLRWVDVMLITLAICVFWRSIEREWTLLGKNKSFIYPWWQLEYTCGEFFWAHPVHFLW
jgi:hypothetical protein